MAAVEEETGRLDASDVRTLAAVRKGYTPFKENDVIFAKITPCMENGKIALAEGLKNRLAYGSTEFFVFRPYEGLLPRFVLRFLLQSSFRQKAERQMTGAVGQKRVPSNYLVKHFFPLPPTREQERILERLDALLSRIAAGEAAACRALKRLHRYRAAVLYAAVTGELTREWRENHKPEESGTRLLKRLLGLRRASWNESELTRLTVLGKPPKDDNWKKRYREAVSPDTTELPQLPPDWTWASVEQMSAPEQGAITDGPFGSNLKSSHYTKSGPRVIRLQNIGDGVFIDERAHISRKHYELLKKHAIYAGDLVIRALGIPAPRACRIPNDIGPAIVKADCIRFKVAEDFIASEYVLLALNSPATQRRTESKIHGIGRPRLNLSEIKSIALPLPPRAEQAQIVHNVARRFAASDRLAATLSCQLDRSRATRESLLHQAFTGTLVSQNGDDEAASVLLDRISAARSAQAKKPKATRMSKSKPKSTRRPLLDVLREHHGPITPEQLFAEAGFLPDEADSFYRELLLLRNLIHEKKPSGTQARTWPHRARVLLELKQR
jgi:type I restriction enzyme S subunit